MSEMNFEQARFNMIEQQVRPWEVLDPRVLDALDNIKRDFFVPERYKCLAYADIAVPIDHQQSMMHPVVEGRMLQALSISPDDRILEIGTGSGFITACLAFLGGNVLSVDIYADFIETCSEKLKSLGIHNVKLQTGDASKGWGEQNYDAIAITGGLPSVESVWLEKLAIGGRLFAVTGEGALMNAVLITRTSKNEWTTDNLFETKLAYLINTTKKNKFNF